MSSRSTSGTGSLGKPSDGDWLCGDPQCGNINFARRTKCNKCGEAQPSNNRSSSKKLLGHEIGKAAAEKSHGLFSAEDWQCNKCGNVNWARRGTCNMCNAPKVGEVEERTGYGGGFNERDNVEYVDRDESDNEYDDYGRRKKKFRGKESEDKPLEGSRNRNKEIPKEPSEINEDSDEEDDGDLSKYALWSDEEDSKCEEKNGSSGVNTKNTMNGRQSSSSRESSRSLRSNSRSQDRPRSRSRDVNDSHNRRRSRSRENRHSSQSSRHRRSRSRSRSGSDRQKDNHRGRRYSRSRSPVRHHSNY